MNVLYFGNAHCYSQNNIGSTTLLTNKDGSDVGEFLYTPFGEMWVEEASTVDINHITRFFTNQQYDKESGLYYYNARYYDPHLGSFITPDPAMDNLNHYAYASANPIRYSDPTGLYDYDPMDSSTWDGYDGQTQPAQNTSGGGSNPSNNPGGSGGGNNEPITPNSPTPNTPSNPTPTNPTITSNNEKDSNLWDKFLEWRENERKKNEEKFEKDLKKYQEWEERDLKRNPLERLQATFTDPRPRNPLIVSGVIPPIGIKGGFAALGLSNKGLTFIRGGKTVHVIRSSAGQFMSKSQALNAMKYSQAAQFFVGLKDGIAAGTATPDAFIGSGLGTPIYNTGKCIGFGIGSILGLFK